MTAPSISNAEFNAWIFGIQEPGIAPRFASVAGDPTTAPGSDWAACALPEHPGRGNYFTLATHHGGGRKGTGFHALHGLLLEDIGTKAKMPPLALSYLIATSQGNHQGAFLFDVPVTDTDLIRRLFDALVVRGFTDPNASGLTVRLGRLPVGANLKNGGHFACKLVQWAPTLRYSIEQIVSALGLVLDPPRPPREDRPSVDWLASPEAERIRVMGELRSALQCLDPNDYAVWIAVGIALSPLGDDGLTLWLEWSATSPKFDEYQAECKWAGFEADSTGYAAIFKRAAAAGWVNPRAREQVDPDALAWADPATLPATASAVPVPSSTSGSAYLVPAMPLATARAFMGHAYPDGTLKRWQGGFYRSCDGAWSEASDDDIRAAVYGFIERRNQSDFQPTQTKVSNVVDALKSAAHLDSTTAPPCWIEGEPYAPAADLVAVANGLLHLRTRTLYPPTPRLFNFNALPVAYSPDSPPPAAWLAFLAQVWPNDAESIATLQEVFGYLLTTDTGQQKIFLIVGPKRSGKGTIARVLHALLGAANIAGPTLASLAGRFGLEPLVGKLAAVLSDARMSGRPDQQAVAENLLRISGEDQVEVDRKHRPSLTLRLGVRVVMLSNEVPRIADASGAMASRFIVLKMTESFYGREDPGLTARLLADLSGVFNWAIEGWHRLNARGYFAPPMSSAAAAQDLADLGSPVATFVREVCIVGAGAEVDSDQLFAAWRTWCTQEGIERAGTKSSFGRDLNSAVQGIRVSQPRDEGARLRVYVGIGLRPGTGWHGQLAIAA